MADLNLRKGAQFTVNKEGKTPADLAEENLERFEQRSWTKEHEEVIKLLRLPVLDFEPVP